jgi:hypothetical protein
MSDSPFSREHKTQFQELLAVGELHAHNINAEYLDFGPWHLGCDLTDSDAANRLKARFRAAARKAAMAAGAPYRVNLLDWWIGKLAHRKPMAFIQGLIRRSAEYCEELETRALELGRPLVPDGPRLLYRDRYPCDWGEPWVLYEGPPRPFSDPKTEFEYWSEQIWSGFSEDLAKLDQMQGPRKRQEKETRQAYWIRVKARVDLRYAVMERTVRGLSYDLAVLHANYLIDRGLRGDAAAREFQNISADLVERVKGFWHDSSKRLGLSNRKQERQVLTVAEPFREVGADLRNLEFETATKPDPALLSLSAAPDPAPPTPSTAGDTVESQSGGKPRRALRAIREDQERRADAKKDLKQALGSYTESLARESDRSLIELARIWGAYSALLYDSLAESHIGLSGDPSELFNESGVLFGGTTVSQVKYDLERIRLPRPKHWPAPQNFGDGVSLELHQSLQSIILSSPVSFTWLLDDPWFIGEIIECVSERVRHWQKQLCSNSFAQRATEIVQELRPQERESTAAASMPSQSPTDPERRTERREMPATEEASLDGLKAAKRRGRRPDKERRDAIRNAISKHGDQWRDHLSEIFTELDSQEVPLGDFQNTKIDLEDGQSTKVSRWDDVDLALGEQRRQIIDALRKYTD